MNFFGGSIDKAIKILEKKEKYTQLDDFIKNVELSSKLDCITKNKQIFEKEDINELLEYCTVLLFNIGKKEKQIKYFNCVKIIEETLNRIKSNSNFDMAIDNMLFKIWEEINEGNYRS